LIRSAPLFAAVPRKDPRERAKDSRRTGEDSNEKENQTGLIVQQSNLSRFLVPTVYIPHVRHGARLQMTPDQVRLP